MHVATRPRVLSLCSGYGGLDLGVRLACPGAVTVCYVERELQAAAVLVARMRDGGLDDAPVWSDLATFDACRWRGAVDLVVAGFPCQPVSVAGKRLGVDDERWLWPHVERVIRDSHAGACLLENVPGLVTAGLRDVLGGLAAIGFDARWGLYSAAEVGAPHERERWFCLAYAGRERPHWLESIGEPERCGAPAARRDREALARFPPPRDRIDEWDGPQPAVRRGADGSAGRLDRLRMLGNGGVPQQVAFALRDLAGRVRTDA